MPNLYIFKDINLINHHRFEGKYGSPSSLPTFSCYSETLSFPLFLPYFEQQVQKNILCIPFIYDPNASENLFYYSIILLQYSLQLMKYSITILPIPLFTLF